MGTLEDKSCYNVKVKYSDKYFQSSPTTFNKKLMMLSFGSAMAANTKGVSIKFFNDIGFSTIFASPEYETGGTEDSVHFVIDCVSVIVSPTWYVAVYVPLALPMTEPSSLVPDKFAIVTVTAFAVQTAVIAIVLLSLKLKSYAWLGLYCNVPSLHFNVYPETSVIVPNVMLTVGVVVEDKVLFPYCVALAELFAGAVPLLDV